jgi:hypothetical protein
MILDGELWGGVNTLERVQSVVRTKEPQDHDWKSFIFLGIHHSFAQTDNCYCCSV